MGFGRVREISLETFLAVMSPQNCGQITKRNSNFSSRYVLPLSRGVETLINRFLLKHFILIKRTKSFFAEEGASLATTLFLRCIAMDGLLIKEFP